MGLDFSDPELLSTMPTGFGQSQQQQQQQQSQQQSPMDQASLEPDEEAVLTHDIQVQEDYAATSTSVEVKKGATEPPSSGSTSNTNQRLSLKHPRSHVRPAGTKTQQHHSTTPSNYKTTEPVHGSLDMTCCL
jgi:hypothetical protein